MIHSKPFHSGLTFAAATIGMVWLCNKTIDDIKEGSFPRWNRKAKRSKQIDGHNIAPRSTAPKWRQWCWIRLRRGMQVGRLEIIQHQNSK